MFVQRQSRFAQGRVRLAPFDGCMQMKLQPSFRVFVAFVFGVQAAGAQSFAARSRSLMGGCV